MSEPLSPAVLEKMLETLTPEIVDSFRRAIETSKWPDGRRITEEQRTTCMQAVIAWEHRHLPENQRTGYIDKGSKQEGEVCDSQDHDHDHHDEKPVTFRH
ncbi:MAG: YeaC family protein [Gammaproteobacteria bacterium]